jgi:hypothetical protein
MITSILKRLIILNMERLVDFNKGHPKKCLPKGIYRVTFLSPSPLTPFDLLVMKLSSDTPNQFWIVKAVGEKPGITREIQGSL